MHTNTNTIGQASYCRLTGRVVAVPRRSRGVALVIVLLLIAILSVMVAEFLYEARINAILARNYQDQLRALYVAKAGVNAAKGMLIHSDPLGANRQEYELAGVISFACMQSSVTPLLGSLLNGQQEQSQSDLPYWQQEGCGQMYLSLNYPIGEDILELKISDEQTRLNLNALVAVVPTNPQNPGQTNPTNPSGRKKTDALSEKPFPGGTREAFGIGNQSGAAVQAGLPNPGGGGIAIPGVMDGPGGQPLQPGVSPVLSTEGTGVNPYVFFQFFELFKMVRDRRQLEMTDDELESILVLLVDWLDFGEYQGELDHDQMSYFEYEDNIYQMKNGPLDTVAEIRIIPGMTDDLFYAIEPYVTVYPMDNKWFSPVINTSGASQEVLYSLIRGATYDNAQPTLSVEDTWNIVQVMLGDSYDPKSGMAKNRDVPPNIRTKVGPFISSGQTGMTGKYYRIFSQGTTPDGIQSSITAVLVRGVLGKFIVMYWREM